jgi:hypothetical protein
MTCLVPGVFSLRAEGVRLESDPRRDWRTCWGAGPFPRVACSIDPRRKLAHPSRKDVVTTDDGKESPFFGWKSLDRFIAQYLPAPSNDDFTRFNTSCSKHSPSVNWRIVYDDRVHLLSQL